MTYATSDEQIEHYRLTGGVMPPSRLAPPVEKPYFAWYGCSRAWPDHLEQMHVLCQHCSKIGLRDGSVRAADFELHLLAEHGLTADLYVASFDEHPHVREFPIWFRP